MENKYEDLKKELKDFENEKKKVKEIIGKIGGTHKSKTNIIINVVFLVCVVAVFILGAVLHKISMPLSLEIGVLLVSLKIAVITSYSIHYTKLYELLVADNCL